MNFRQHSSIIFGSGLFLLVFGAAVYSEELSKGIGPVTEIKLDSTINSKQVAKGQEIFKTKCSACHKIEERYVGPALQDVTKRRSPEWIMNMILNPQEMLEKDPVASKLLEEFMAPMASQDLTQDEARSVLEFFRNNDSGAKKAPSKKK